MRFGLQLLMALALLLVLLTGCGNSNGASYSNGASNSNTAEDPIIVTYTGGSISAKEFHAFLGSTLFFYPAFYEEKDDIEYKHNVRDQLVALKTLKQSFGEDVLEQAASKADSIIEQVRESLESLNSLGVSNKEMLEENNLTLNDLKNYLIDTTAAMIQMGQQIETEKVKQRYEQYVEMYPEVNLVVSGESIFIPKVDETPTDDDLEKLESLHELLQRKQKIENASNEYTVDVFENLELRKLTNQQLISAYAETEIGAFSDMIETIDGYYLFRIDDRYAKEFSDFEAELRTIMAQEVIVDYVSNEIPAMILKSNIE